MKITAFLIFAAIMQVSAATYAQKLTLHQKNVTLKQLFDEIRKQTGYDVLYQPGKVNTAYTFNADFNETPLPEVLDAGLNGQPLDYVIEDKTVVIREKEPNLLDRLKRSLAPAVTVTGKVVNELGEPMPGVTIKEKSNPNNGVITGANGIFSITVADENAALIFTYIGYESQELRAKDIPSGSTVTLKASSNNLKEVVINKGYYNTNQELNTGDVASISAKTIAEQPVSNPLAAMEGRMPGVFITQGSGISNGTFSIQIRGQNSIANGNTPLYVVDGVPYTLTSQSDGGFGTQNLSGGSPLSFIDPSEIESIAVLKDADATAIYGSRGANGVVLITTKKGIPGAAKVGVNVLSGIGQVAHTVQYLNTQQYIQMRQEAFQNDGVTPDASSAPDLLVFNTNSYTDWNKVLIGGTDNYTNVHADISGGNTNFQYLVGTNYHRETEVFPGDNPDQKASVDFNINSTSDNKRLKFSLSGNYLVDVNHAPGIDLTSQVAYLPPDAPSPYNSDGSLNWANESWPSGNPLAYLLQKYDGVTNNLVSHANLSYLIVSGLTLGVSAGYNAFQSKGTNIYPTTSYDPSYGITTGNSYFNSNSTSSWIVEPQLNYNTKLGPGRLKTLLGGTFLQTNTLSDVLYASGYTSDALLYSIGAAGSIQDQGEINSQYKYNAVYAAFNYNIHDKYLLNLTGRRDGSSRFGPGKQFANFGAIGAAWIFSKEKLIVDNLSFLSFGKLRGSFGTSGNDQIGDYKYLDTYKSTTHPYEGVGGIQPSSLSNPDYGWEVNKKLEGGIDLGFLQDRIFFSASYYYNRSSNELVNAPLPSITGFTTITENLPATVQNTGWEFSLNTTNVKTSKFSWTSSFNLTIPRNKLVAFPNLATSTYASFLVIGEPLGIQKVFHEVDVNPQTGIYEFLAANGTLTSNPVHGVDNNTVINMQPKFYGGFENSLKYGGIQLDFLFQFTKQIGPLYLFNFEPGYEGYNQPVGVLARWQTAGDHTNIAQYTQSFGSAYLGYNAAAQSDLVYGDASYIRLKNLELSYQLPEKWKDQLGLKNCRIYIQGQNLFTLTKYKGYDPETTANINFPSLPPLRILGLGIQGTF